MGRLKIFDVVNCVASQNLSYWLFNFARNRLSIDLKFKHCLPNGQGIKHRSLMKLQWTDFKWCVLSTLFWDNPFISYSVQESFILSQRFKNTLATSIYRTTKKSLKSKILKLFLCFVYCVQFANWYMVSKQFHKRYKCSVFYYNVQNHLQWKLKSASLTAINFWFSNF